MHASNQQTVAAPVLPPPALCHQPAHTPAPAPPPDDCMHMVVDEEGIRRSERDYAAARLRDRVAAIERDAERRRASRAQ